MCRISCVGRVSWRMRVRMMIMFVECVEYLSSSLWAGGLFGCV